MKQERIRNGRCNRVARLEKPDGLSEARDFSHEFFTADINGAANILRKEYPGAFDGIKDFTYLYVTTISIDYKDLYKNAKTCVGRPKSYKYHKSGRYTAVRHMKRSHKKCEYNKLWGKGKSVWTPDKNKQDMQQEKTA